jgi:aminoglycoside phosphotransferase (APT) family kinase protein
MPDNGLSLELVAAIAREAVSTAATHVERVHDGVSTLVYRISSERDAWYLRVLPDPTHSFAPEVTVHERLRALGVCLPEVVYVADPHPLIGRSVMVLVALPGAALFQAAPPEPDALQRIVADAGRDLARLGSVRVEGYGRVARRRDTSSALTAPWTTYRDAALQGWESDLAALARLGLTETLARKPTRFSGGMKRLNANQPCVGSGV